MEELLRRALADPERGLGRPAAGRGRGAGDAGRAQRRRRPGRALGPGAGGRARRRAKPVDVAAIEDALQRKALDYDRQGDRHYDFVSAWIKATRGSDVDASLYYLAVMLEGGEDPRFIARRMVILASEDVGNADPQALLVADAAARAVDRVGLPECALNLAQAAVYLALAPKSNASYKALARGPRRGARATAPRRRPTTCATPTTPAPRRSAAASGYRYAHDEPGGVSDQQLLPDGLEDRRFYAPTDRGFEAELGRRLEALRTQISASRRMTAQLPGDAGVSMSRLSKLEPGRADIPAGGLDWGPPAGTYTGGRGRRAGLRSAPSSFGRDGRPRSPERDRHGLSQARWPERLRLGGMALRNGLLIHGPTHWAAAVRDRDGQIQVASERKPELAPKLVGAAAGAARAAETGRGDGGAAAGAAAAAGRAAALRGLAGRRRGRRDPGR